MNSPNNIRKPFFTNKRLTVIIIIVAVLTLLSPFIINYYNNKEQRYKEYKDHFSELILDSIKIKTVNITHDTSVGVIDVDGLNYWVKIKNNTDNVVTIKSFLTLDYLPKTDFIREKIKNKDTSFVNYVIDTSFTTYVLQSKESHWFDLPLILNSFSSKSNNNAHTCIIYTNQFGGLYDYYFIQEIKKNITFNKPFDYSIDTVTKKRAFYIPDILDFTDNRQTLSPYVYTEEETKFLYSIINRKSK